MRELAHSDGLFACPEGAATYSALKAMVRERKVAPTDRVVLFNTGAALKYVDLLHPALPIVDAAHPIAAAQSR